MNTNNKSLAAIAVVMAIAVSVIFFIIDVTVLCIIAYIFALIGIVGLCFGGYFLMKNMKSYPWAAAVPGATIRYLIVEGIFSIIFVALEQFNVYSLSAVIFTVVHIIILAFFAQRVIMLNVGTKEIERVDNKVKLNIVDWKILIVDLEALAEKSPDVKKVYEEVKYCDPVTNPAIAEYDAKIRDSIVELESAVDVEDEAKVSELCVIISNQVKDRNNRVKLLK